MSLFTFAKVLNLCLLVLYPVAWWAPLARASVLPFFGGNEVSVLTGIDSLWETDLFLCVVVVLFAVVAPYAKTIATIWLQFRQLTPRALTFTELLAKLSMTDIFLIALYVVMMKGIGIGHIEIAWGLYLFTLLVLSSLWVGWITRRALETS